MGQQSQPSDASLSPRADHCHCSARSPRTLGEPNGFTNTFEVFRSGLRALDVCHAWTYDSNHSSVCVFLKLEAPCVLLTEPSSRPRDLLTIILPRIAESSLDNMGNLD